LLENNEHAQAVMDLYVAEHPAVEEPVSV